jgi:uncharacterized protein (TIGR02145 family)
VVTGAGPSATPITFEAGKRYTFKLDLDAYSRLIIFNPPTVDSWDEQKEQNLTDVVGVGTVQWAKYDLHKPGEFTFDEYTPGLWYQWKRNTGWAFPAKIGYNADGTTTNTYPSSGAAASAWTDVPCPAGYRLPTVAEYNSLVSASTRAVVTAPNSSQKFLEFTVTATGQKLRFAISGYISTAGVISQPTRGYYHTVTSGTNQNALFRVNDDNTTGWSSINSNAEGELIRCVAQ